MPSVACIPPEAMRRALESNGYKLIAEDAYNWAFAKSDKDVPIMVPHRVRILPVPIMNHIHGAADPVTRKSIMAEALAHSNKVSPPAPAPALPRTTTPHDDSGSGN